ncbi:MAG: GGDEF domain-containing protein [Betaproteobacteria bacterium]|nr:GGDEF domain-containing protein [Betaproteobacteria bacterium]
MWQRLGNTFLHWAQNLLHELQHGELVWLLSPAQHMTLLANRRAAMIISRVRLWATLFAILTPLWIVVDLMVFKWPMWGVLAGSRLLASLAFAALALMVKRDGNMRHAYLALVLLFAIPTVFFIVTYPMVAPFRLQGLASSVALGYTFLPFLVLAGLGIFPLTLLEGMVFSLPALAGTWMATVWLCNCADQYNLLGMYWLLILIAGVATISGMSQLGFTIALVRQAVRDVLTNAFTRASGGELLDIQYILSVRNGSPLTVAFVDLDNFKQINDQHGHEAGDEALRQATNQIRAHARMGDMLVRWGGEEFLLVFPNTDIASARLALERLREAGLGLRPNGEPLTASIGLAERLKDGQEDWQGLIALADRRMYEAKRTGKNRVVYSGEGLLAKPQPA